MTSIRILDPLTMSLVNIKKIDTDRPEKGIRIIILSMFSIGIIQEVSLRHALAFHFGFLPLRLFVGFNISNRWIL